MLYLGFYAVAVRHIRITSERLGAGGGYDTVHAGHKRSCSHCTFCGATPPLAPNRQLAAAHFVGSFVSFISLDNICSFSVVMRFYVIAKSNLVMITHFPNTFFIITVSVQKEPCQTRTVK